jgi:hypothetical protein
VNDLDLEVTTGGQTYLGNQFSGALSVTGGTPDRSNNVESVYLPDGNIGPITIVVRAAALDGDGVPGTGTGTDQDFAIVAYNVTTGDVGPVPSATLPVLAALALAGLFLGLARARAKG